jgi:aryl-alcohol dehydrogenase-like predicted oxidoreductase
MVEIALGCEALGGVDRGDVVYEEVIRTVRDALSNGITTFDVADVYGLGQAEIALASVLGNERNSVTIVTKGGVRWQTNGPRRRASTWKDTSPEYLAQALDGSLRRLRLESIPLYLVHWPDCKTKLDETLDFLEAAKTEGKIRAYGLSNYSAESISKITQTHRPSAIQGELNLLCPTTSTDMLSVSKKRGLLCLTYGALAQGLLSGKYTRDSSFKPNDRRHRLGIFSVEAFDRNRQLLQAVKQISDEVGCTQSQVAMRWVIQSGLSDVVVIGPKTPNQLSDSLSSMNWRLTALQMRTLSAARESVLHARER